MKTADLIEQLGADFKTPIKLRPLWKQTLAVLGWTALSVEAVFLFFHVRSDLTAETGRLQFVMSGVALLLSWMVFSWALSLLEIPGRKVRHALWLGAIAVGLLVTGFTTQAVCVRSMMAMASGLNPDGLRCSMDVLLLGLLPVGLTLYRLRKGAPVRLMLTGAVLGFACASLGAFALQFSCANDHPIHLLTWHIVMPHIAMSGSGAWLAQRFLRW